MRVLLPGVPGRYSLQSNSDWSTFCSCAEDAIPCYCLKRLLITSRAAACRDDGPNPGVGL
jgi:hypothetical protein